MSSYQVMMLLVTSAGNNMVSHISEMNTIMSEENLSHHTQILSWWVTSGKWKATRAQLYRATSHHVLVLHSDKVIYHTISCHLMGEIKSQVRWNQMFSKQAANQMAADLVTCQYTSQHHWDGISRSLTQILPVAMAPIKDCAMGMKQEYRTLHSQVCCRKE